MEYNRTNRSMVGYATAAASPVLLTPFPTSRARVRAASAQAHKRSLFGLNSNENEKNKDQYLGGSSSPIFLSRIAPKTDESHSHSHSQNRNYDADRRGTATCSNPKGGLFVGENANADATHIASSSTRTCTDGREARGGGLAPDTRKTFAAEPCAGGASALSYSSPNNVVVTAAAEQRHTYVGLDEEELIRAETLLKEGKALNTSAAASMGEGIAANASGENDANVKAKGGGNGKDSGPPTVLLAAEQSKRIRVVPRPNGSSNTERSFYQSSLRASSAVAKLSRTPAGLLRVDAESGRPLSLNHVTIKRMRYLMLKDNKESGNTKQDGSIDTRRRTSPSSYSHTECAQSPPPPLPLNASPTNDDEDLSSGGSDREWENHKVGEAGRRRHESQLDATNVYPVTLGSTCNSSGRSNTRGNKLLGGLLSSQAKAIRKKSRQLSPPLPGSPSSSTVAEGRSGGSANNDVNINMYTAKDKDSKSSLPLKLLHAIFTPTPTRVETIIARAGVEALRMNAEVQTRREGALAPFIMDDNTEVGIAGVPTGLGLGAPKSSRRAQSANASTFLAKKAQIANSSEGLVADNQNRQRYNETPVAAAISALLPPAANNTPQGKPPLTMSTIPTTSKAAPTRAASAANEKINRVAFAKMTMIINDQASKEQADRTRARSNALNNLVAIINDDPRAKTEVMERAYAGKLHRFGTNFSANTLAYPPGLAAIVAAKKAARAVDTEISGQLPIMGLSPIGTPTISRRNLHNNDENDSSMTASAGGGVLMNWMARNAQRAKLYAHLVEADRAKFLEDEDVKCERAAVAREKQFYERVATLEAQETVVRGAGKSVAHRWASIVTFFASVGRIRDVIASAKERRDADAAAAALADREYHAYYSARRGTAAGATQPSPAFGASMSMSIVAAVGGGVSADSTLSADRVATLIEALKGTARFGIAVRRYREGRKHAAADTVRKFIISVRDGSKIQLRMRQLLAQIRFIQRHVRRFLEKRRSERELWHRMIQHYIEERLAFTRQITIEYEKEYRRRRAALVAQSGGGPTPAAPLTSSPQPASTSTHSTSPTAVAPTENSLALDAATFLIYLHGAGTGPGIGGSVGGAGGRGKSPSASGGGPSLQGALMAIRHQQKMLLQSIQHSSVGVLPTMGMAISKLQKNGQAHQANTDGSGAYAETRRGAGSAHNTGIPLLLLAEATRVLTQRMGVGMVTSTSQGGTNANVVRANAAASAGRKSPPHQKLEQTCAGTQEAQRLSVKAASSPLGHRRGSPPTSSFSGVPASCLSSSSSLSGSPTRPLPPTASSSAVGGNTSVTGPASVFLLSATASSTVRPNIGRGPPITVHHASALSKRYASLSVQRDVEVARAVLEHTPSSYSRISGEELFAISCLPAAAARFWRPSPEKAVFFARETHELPYADRTAIRLPSKYRERLVAFFQARALRLYHQHVSRWRTANNNSKAKYEWELELALHAAKRSGQDAETAAKSVTRILPPFPHRKHIPTSTEARFVVLVGFAIQFLEKRALLEATATISQRANVKTAEGRAVLEHEKLQIATKALGDDNIEEVAERLLYKYLGAVAAAKASLTYSSSSSSPPTNAVTASLGVIDNNSAIQSSANTVAAANAATARQAHVTILHMFAGIGGLSESLVTGTIDEDGDGNAEGGAEKLGRA